MFLLLIVFIILIFVHTIIATTTTTELPSSCIGLKDGYHWIKLLQDDIENNIIYPAINVLCSNEYMILNVDHDSNIKSYFKSFDTYHYALSGADHQTSVNWQQWFIPSDNNNNAGYFLLSPDCLICDQNDNFLQEFGTNTAYYMTGTMFGCLSTYKAERDCAWDWDSYQCNYCTMTTSDADLGYHIFNRINDYDEYKFYLSEYDDAASKHDPNSWFYEQTGLCGVYPRPSDSNEIAQNREECFAFDNQYNPSIGNDGRFCQCYKPSLQQTIKIDINQLMQYQNELLLKELKINDEIDDNDNNNNNIHELYQSDFLYGTYRIIKSGTYILMEDIELDFNSGDLENPNSNSDDSWWPNIEQSSEYPGAYSTRDEYFMGFFAGITIEADDVILDLNGFEIAMSKPFYYQQRFFAIIALKSVVFNLNQGPGIFGTDPKYATNTIIKNGKIGLSSHHGIHGQGNENILIENVHVYNFETHGIQFSAFNNIKLKNVEIGPSSNIAYLTGEYGYARFTLQRLERIKNDPNKYIKENVFPFSFANRDKIINDIQDIIDPLRESMDIAFKYVINGLPDNYKIDDKTKRLFINEEGIPYGAVMYGLFLNLYFANVFQIHPSLKHSINAEIENVKIHDLIHKTREYLRLDEFSITPYSNPYNAALDAKSILGQDIVNLGYDNIPWDHVSYIGDVLIDAHITMDLCTNDWGEKGLMVIGQTFSNWALGKHKWDPTDPNLHPFLGCNGDRMTHSAKGTMGIRIDGVENIKFNNLNIYNLYEKSPIGLTLCSEYWDGNMENFFGTGHFLQNTPYLYGYTGNMVHGIFSDFTDFSISGDSSIYDLYSNTGLVYGIGAYTNTQIDIYDKFTISKLHSGIKLIDIDTTTYKHPYHPSITKPFHIIHEWVKYENTFYSNINIDNNDNLKIKCLFGKDGIINDLDSDQTDDDIILYTNTIECNENFLNFKHFVIDNNNNYDYHKWYSISFVLTILILLFVVIRKTNKKEIINIDNNNNYGSIIIKE